MVLQGIWTWSCGKASHYMIIKLSSIGVEFAFHNNYFPAVWMTNLGGGRGERIQTELLVGRQLSVVLERLKAIKKLWRKGAEGRDLKDMASGQTDYYCLRSSLVGSKAKTSTKCVLSLLGLCNWVNGIDICNISIYIYGIKKLVTSFWERKYLRHPNSRSSVFLWGRKHRWCYPYFMSKGVNFLPTITCSRLGSLLSTRLKNR